MTAFENLELINQAPLNFDPHPATNFKGYTLRSSSLVTSMRPPLPIKTLQEIKETSDRRDAANTAKPGSVRDTQPIIYNTPGEALEAMRSNRDRLTAETQKAVTGLRGEHCRRHIVYAWKPIVRRVGKENRVGQIALHVYHATKGWKIVHGHNNVEYTLSEPSQQIAVVSGG